MIPSAASGSYVSTTLSQVTVGGNLSIQNNFHTHQAEARNYPLLKDIQAGKPAEWRIPRQDHLFVGRKGLLEALENKLPSLSLTANSSQKASAVGNSSTQALVLTACAGLGGIGKTQVALQYIHHTQNTYNLKAWFDAEDINELRQQIISFAKNLGLKTEKPSVQETTDYLKKWLQENPGWLLIFDNAENYQAIKEFLPEKGGSILITTRFTNWPSKISTLPIDLMDEKDAVELLETLSSRKDPEMKILAEKLGYLPLALAQAGAYIHKNKITTKEYLNFLESYRAKILSDKTLPEGANHLPVAVTWNMSLAAVNKGLKAEKISVSAESIMIVCAHLAPDNIPKDLLLTWFKVVFPEIEAPELVLNSILTLLTQYSLIGFKTDRDLSIHRLVQDVIREQQRAIVDNQWYIKLFMASHLYFISETKPSLEEILRIGLLPHQSSMLSFYEKEKFKTPTDPWFVVLMTHMAYASYWYLGDMESAQRYATRVLSLKINPVDPLVSGSLASIYCTLGNIYEIKCEYKKQLEMQLKAFVIYEKQKDFKEANRVKNNIANAYGNLGKTILKQKMHKEVLEFEEKNYEKGNIETISTLRNLGISSLEQRKFQDAENYFLRAKNIALLNYKEEHIRHLELLVDLGTLYIQWINPDKSIKNAIDILENALKFCREAPLPYLRIKIHCLSQLGIAYRRVSDLKNAVERLAEAKKLLKTVENPNLQVEVMVNLGNVYGDMGDNKERLKITREALAIEKILYGNQPHINLVVTLNNIAETELDENNPSDALRALEESIKILEIYYTSNNLDQKEFPRTLYYITCAYQDLNQDEMAFNLLNRYIKRITSFHEDSPNYRPILLDIHDSLRLNIDEHKIEWLALSDTCLQYLKQLNADSIKINEKEKSVTIKTKWLESLDQSSLLELKKMGAPVEWEKKDAMTENTETRSSPKPKIQ